MINPEHVSFFSDVFPRFYLRNWPMQFSKNNSVICLLVKFLRDARLAFAVLFRSLFRPALRVSTFGTVSSLMQLPTVMVSVRFINQWSRSYQSTKDRLWVVLYVCVSVWGCNSWFARVSSALDIARVNWYWRPVRRPISFISSVEWKSEEQNRSSETEINNKILCYPLRGIIRRIGGLRDPRWRHPATAANPVLSFSDPRRHRDMFYPLRSFTPVSSQACS